PKLVSAWINRGIVYTSMGQPDKAIADFSKAIELDPKGAAAWTKRGIAYEDLGQHEKALADLSKVCELIPNSTVPDDRDGLARSHHDLAALLERTRQFSDGEKQYRTAIAIWEKLAADVPSEPMYRVHAAVTYGYDVARLLAASGQSQKEEQALRQAVA